MSSAIFTTGRFLSIFHSHFSCSISIVIRVRIMVKLDIMSSISDNTPSLLFLVPSGPVRAVSTDFTVNFPSRSDGCTLRSATNEIELNFNDE